MNYVKSSSLIFMGVFYSVMYEEYLETNSLPYMSLELAKMVIYLTYWINIQKSNLNV